MISVFVELLVLLLDVELAGREDGEAGGVAGDAGGVAAGVAVPESMFNLSVYYELFGLMFLSVSVILMVYCVLNAEVFVGLKVKQSTDLFEKVVVSLISTVTTIASLSGSE